MLTFLYFIAQIKMTLKCNMWGMYDQHLKVLNLAVRFISSALYACLARNFICSSFQAPWTPNSFNNSGARTSKLLFKDYAQFLELFKVHRLTMLWKDNCVEVLSRRIKRFAFAVNWDEGAFCGSCAPSSGTFITIFDGTTKQRIEGKLVNGAC